MNMKINGIEVPEPMREMPKYDSWYWYTLPSNLNGVGGNFWKNDAVDTERLRRGICHSTEAAARKHFEALTAPSRADEQKPNPVQSHQIEPACIAPDREHELARKVQKLFSDARDEREKERQQQRFELAKASLKYTLSVGVSELNAMGQVGDSIFERVATTSVKFADATLAELERTK